MSILHLRSVETGRRFCMSERHQGARWLPVCYFNAKGWIDSAKTIPAGLQSMCQTCQRIDTRIRAGVRRRGQPYRPRKRGKTREQRNAERIERRRSMSPQERFEVAERRRQLYHDRKRDLNKWPKLPAGPFRVWLAEKVQEYGIGNVAASVGVDARLIRTYIEGTYMKNGSKYEVKYVQLGTVDRYMIAFEEHYWELYPEIDE